MYIPKDFNLYEVLPRDIYESTMRYGDRRWMWFDVRLLITLQELRNNEGKITINDWRWHGNNQYRGYRPFDCEVGAQYSQHKFGRAADLIFANTTAEKVRQKFLSNPKSYPHITCIEQDVFWFHFDVRNWNVHRHGILIV